MSTARQLLMTFLVNSLWQIPLIAVVAALSARLMRHGPSVYRHFVWVAALGLCLGLPLTSLWSPIGASRGNSSSSQVSMANGGSSGAESKLAHKRFSITGGNHVRSLAFPPLLTWVLVGCYTGFLLYRTARIGWSLRCTLRFRNAGTLRDLPRPLFSIAKRCAKEFALPDVAIICSPNGLGPATLSFPHPSLILPERFFTEVSEPDFASAVCHELAHIQRHDFLLNLLYEFTSTPVAFHPATKWIKDRIALTRELACDEAAAAKLPTRRGYARSLLNIAKSLGAESIQKQSKWALGLFDANTLEERMMNLLGKTNRMSRRWGFVLTAVVASLLTVTCMVISAFSFQVAPSGNVSGDVQQFLGTWTAAHDGTPYLILELHSEKGALVGGIKVCSFNLDMKNGTDAVTITNKIFTEVLPIRNLGISGKSLSFDWKDPDGDKNHLKLEVSETNAGRLHWLGLPAEFKVAPMPVTRKAR